MKHPKEKKAEEWLESLNKEPNIKEVQEFTKADLDLNTICICLIDKEQSEIFSNTTNKNNLSNLEFKDAFFEYKEYPQWFYVFVPKNVLTAQMLYASKDDKYNLVEELMENPDYIKDLVAYGVFDSELNFDLDLKIVEGKIDEFLIEIQNQIEAGRDINIKDCSNDKFRYFQLGSFTEAKNNFLKKSKERLLEDSQKYIDALSLLDSKADKLSAEEFFYDFMPPSLRVEGVLELKEDAVLYSFKKDLFEVLEERMRHNSKVEEAIKKEKVKKAGAMSFNIIKVGMAVAVDVFAGFPIMSTIKGAIDIADTTKDSLQIGKDTIDLFFHDHKVLKEIYEEFQTSGYDKFKPYLIEQIRYLVYNGLEKYKLKFHIQDETFDYIYQQFMKEYVFERIGEVEDFVLEQSRDTEDPDLFWIAYLFEGMADKKPLAKEGEEHLCIT